MNNTNSIFKQNDNAILEFETKVKKLEINTSRKYAIKTIILSLEEIYEENIDYQTPGYACYLLGLPFSYEEEFKEALND